MRNEHQRGARSRLKDRSRPWKKISGAGRLYGLLLQCRPDWKGWVGHRGEQMFLVGGERGGKSDDRAETTDPGF